MQIRVFSSAAFLASRLLLDFLFVRCGSLASIVNERLALRDAPPESRFVASRDFALRFGSASLQQIYENIQFSFDWIPKEDLGFALRAMAGFRGFRMQNQSYNSVYRSREVVQILGVSRRQLQYWAQTDLVKPSVQTQGGHHRYTFQDLVALKATKRLMDAGVSLQRIRKSIKGLQSILPNVQSPLEELVLIATDDVVLVFHGNTAFEAVSGQEWILEIAQFEREIHDWRQNGLPKAKVRPLRAVPQVHTIQTA